MKVEELTEELRRQADEVWAWPGPSLDDLAVRRSRRRRRRALALGCAAVVAAGLGVAAAQLAGGTDIERRTVGPAASSPRPLTIHQWKVERCAPKDRGGCNVPEAVTVNGRHYTAVGGGQQPMVAGNGVNRELSYTSAAKVADQHVFLYGALNSGRGSELDLRAGEVGKLLSTLHVGVDSGMVMLAGAPVDHPEFSVRENGPVDHDEVLVIEEYAPLP